VVDVVNELKSYGVEVQVALRFMTRDFIIVGAQFYWAIAVIDMLDRRNRAEDLTPTKAGVITEECRPLNSLWSTFDSKLLHPGMECEVSLARRPAGRTGYHHIFRALCDLGSPRSTAIDNCPSHAVLATRQSKACCMHKYTYNRIMRYTYDPKKQAANLKKHGYDFEDAPQVIESGRTVTFEDRRFGYDEPRFITLGLLRADVVVIATA